MSESLIYIIMSGIVGVIVGFGLSYITSRHKDKGRLEDELTKARRELASQKRVLNDFFSSSNALFEQLESSYQIYAHHIGEQSYRHCTVSAYGQPGYTAGHRCP